MSGARVILLRPEIHLSSAEIWDALRARPALVPLRGTPQTIPVIGGGPAGMSCALWLKNYGFRPVLIEREAVLGGMQRRSPYKNDWLLGWPNKLARDNADVFERHIRQVGVEVLASTQVRSLQRLNSGFFKLTISHRAGAPQSFVCPAAVIATGTEFRGDDWIERVGNAREFLRRGLVHIGPACVGEPGADFGSEVLIVGGGDNAFDVANYLVERNTRVTIVMRSATARAQHHLQARLMKFERSGLVEFRALTKVKTLVQSGKRVVVIFSSGAPIGVDNVILTLGYTPNADSSFLKDLTLDRDSVGYLRADRNAATSCPGIFAVGDIANPDHPCTATALGSGTVAARSIQQRIQMLEIRSTPRTQSTANRAA